MNSGIYQIKNVKNGKLYIGSSIQIEIRWQDHLRDLRNNKHCNKHLQNAFNCYGEENFLFEVIDVLPNNIDEKKLLEIEQQIINNQIFENLYNINRETGRPPRPQKGCKRPASVGQRISATKKDRKHLYTPRVISEEHKSKVSAAQKGKIKTKEHRQKIAETLRGRTNTACLKLWKLIHPDGTEEIFNGLKEPCEKYHLKTNDLSAVARGRQHTHKGFKCELVSLADLSSK
jgi:group I intron endonuclease